MKKLLMGSVLALSSVFAVTACTSVNATTDTRPAASKMQNHYKEGMQRGGLNGPMSQLDLTATQQAQIKAIMEAKQGNRKAEREKYKTERMQTHNAVLQVLTPEQREKLAKIKADKMAKGYKGSEHRKMHGKEHKGL